MSHTTAHQETRFTAVFWDVRISLRRWHLHLSIAKFTVTHPVDSSIDKHCLSSVQFSSVAQLCSTLCDPMNHGTPGLPVHQELLKSTQPVSILLVMPSNHLILCCPLLLLPSIFPSIRVFSNESALHIRWPKYWNFSFNISPSNEHQD